MQCIIIPSTGVSEDRVRLLHWAKSFNEKYSSNVGGVISVNNTAGMKLNHERGHSQKRIGFDRNAVAKVEHKSKYMVSIASGERVSVGGSETDVREQYSWAREEILCSFNAKVVKVILFDEIGPEIFHHLGLDSAVKACLSETLDTNEREKIFLIIADPTVADYLPVFYKDINPNVVWKRYDTLEDFLRADLPVRPTNVEFRLFSWNYEYWERYSEDTQLRNVDHRQVLTTSSSLTYSLARYPLLVLSVGIVLTELVAYVILRQVVIVSEKIIRKNSDYHKRMKMATHYETWKRLARELDVIQSKHSGSIDHVPSLAQFSKSLAGLSQQLYAERLKQEEKKPGVEIDPQIRYTLEDATMSCLLDASSSILEHVQEELYSSNYSGRNLDFRHYVQNFISALNEIERIKLPSSPERLKVWQNYILDYTHRNHLFSSNQSLNDLDMKPQTNRLLLEHQLSGIGTADSTDDIMLDKSFRGYKKAVYAELYQRYGQSALLLSGGAANAYYHIGVIKCLLEQGLLPRHFSGASGGALVGSFVATRTDEELRSILQPEKLCKIFDPCEGGLPMMFRNLLKIGTAFDVDVWIDKMKTKITGPMTFKEAYQRTGKTLTITVYNVDAKNHTRCLNHKTAPDVLIYSAVLASSALPKLLPAIELHRKDSNGKIVPYHAFGKFFRDGSFENELPVDTLKQHFNVKFTIVSMVEPHISPFFYERRGSAGNVVTHNKGRGYRGGFVLSFLERLIKFDIKKWLEIIRDFELMPKIGATDMNSLFLGRTRGVVTTAVPIYLRSYLNIIRDPNTPEKFNWYLQTGQKMIYPKLEMIKDHMIIEKRLKELSKAHT